MLAFHAKLRAVIVPGRVEKASEPADEPMQRAVRMSWARLLKRIFDSVIDKDLNVRNGAYRMAGTGR